MPETLMRTPEDAELGVPLTSDTREAVTAIWEESEEGYLDAARALKQDILDRRWQSMIADDTRARFPAMVLRDIISQSYSEQRSGSAMALSYLAGTRFMDADSPSLALSYDEYLNRLKNIHKDQRLLFVTDWIESGETVKNAMSLLAKKDIKFDVLSLMTDYVHGEPSPSLESILGEYDAGAKFYHINTEWDSGSIPYALGRLKELGPHKKGFYWPLDKRRDLARQDGTLIPVGVAQWDTEEYRLLRQLSREMGERVYKKVFYEESLS